MAALVQYDLSPYLKIPLMHYKHLLFVAIAGLFFAGSAMASDNTSASSSTEKPKRCLSLSAIRDMTVIDRKTLLFEMPGHKYYVNHLPHACPGIDIGNPIMYKTSQDSLCNLDLITVLDPVGGGFERGATCGLGLFNPVSREHATQLKKQSRSH